MSVDLSIADGVATILLNRPDKLNAFIYPMWGQLAEHLDRCAADRNVRAIVLAGAGRGFCAGADISGQHPGPVREPGFGGAFDGMTEYNAVIRRIFHMRKPTIAAVRGPAVGIAWTMVLACDFVLVTESAKFRPAFLNLAKVPEGGIVYLMSRLIGQFKARDIIYRARFVSGREAAEIGLATRLVAEEALMEEAGALARELAAAPPVSFQLAKRMFNTDVAGFDQFVDLELNTIVIGTSTQDAVEGMAAFKEKRAPRFTGR
ncbi:MAG: enoyl-CoA hydratase/isomerase family protein [Gammaproteobacteria bacterium]